MKLLLPGALLLLSLCLGAGTLYALVIPHTPDEVSEPPLVVPPLAPETGYSPPPKDTFAVINARPAFSPDRQAIAEPALISARGDAQSPPDVTLSGVIIGPQKSIALLNRSGAAQAISATTDQVIDGWRIARIEPDRVLFRSGVADYEIRLRSATVGGPAAGQAVVTGGKTTDQVVLAGAPVLAVPAPGKIEQDGLPAKPAFRPAPVPQDNPVPPQSEMKIIGLPKILPKPPTFTGKR
jgi:hypothetical protein